MSKKNLLSGRDKELQELADQYETAKAEKQPIYLDADDLADLADWYAVRGKFPKAMEVTEYGLSLHPANTALMVEQAYLFMDTQNRDKAQVIIESISETYSPEVKVLRANLLLGEGKINEAEQLLDTIEDKEDLANIADVAYMYLDMGYTAKALTWIQYGSELYADEEAYIALSADCFYAEGEVEKAEQFYNKLIDINPYSAPYWYGLARCYFSQKQFDKAIEACDYVLIADDEFAEAYVMKGHSFFQLGNEDSALEYYMLAEKQKAITTDFLNMFIGLHKISKRNWEEGYRYLELAIQGKETDFLTLPSLYANAALCLYKLGKKRKAHQYCKKGSELIPEDIDPYLIEGRIYMEDGKQDKAIEKWDIALGYAPYAETWNEIGMYCLEIGRFSYANHAFERVRDLDPDFEGLNQKLTSLYLLLKDKENFLKYNQLCEHPFQESDMDRLDALLESGDKQELAKIVNSILKTIE